MDEKKSSKSFDFAGVAAAGGCVTGGEVVGAGAPNMSSNASLAGMARALDTESSPENGSISIPDADSVVVNQVPHT